MESELKILLSFKEYSKLLSFCDKKPTKQTNSYFFIKKDVMIRIREKGNKAEVTCKKRIEKKKNVYLNEEINVKISQKELEKFFSEGISTVFIKKHFGIELQNKLTCLGKMDTYRSNANLVGFFAELDRNEYLFTTDFELEFESFDDKRIAELKKLLKRIGINERKSKPKSQRFAERELLLNTKRYETVLFDFDGTICDSAFAIKKSLTKICQAFGKDISGLDINKYIGPPLVKIFEDIFDDENIVNEALALSAKISKQEGIEKSKIYDGILECFKLLKNCGARIGIASSRKVTSIWQILENVDLDKYIDFAYGTQPNRLEKSDSIKTAIDEQKIDAKKCLMIGDRFFDLEAAKICGIDGAAVLYGFGTAEELFDINNVAVLKTTMELKEFLKNVTAVY